MTYPADVLAHSPAGYWRLNETSGAPQDSSGNARHANTSFLGTYGAPPLIAGDGTAMTCNGSNQGFQVAANAAFAAPSGSDVTVIAWIKTTTTTLSRIVEVNGSGAQLVLSVTAAGVASVTRLGASITGTITVNDGQPHMLAVAEVGATVTLYVDGVADGTGTRSSNNTASAGIYVGYTASLSSDYNGVVDEVAYLPTGLTGTQVAALYTSGTTAPATSINAAATLTAPAHTPVAAFALTPVTPSTTIGFDAALAAGGNTPVAAFLLAPDAPTALILAATLNPPPRDLTAVFDLTVETLDDTLIDGEYGRQRFADATSGYTPPVDTPAYPVAVGLDVATTYEPPRRVGVELHLDIQDRAAKATTRLRVTIGGRDYTYFRGHPTPDPEYLLVEPLYYGPAVITLPQIKGAFEDLEEDPELAPIHDNARVTIDQVSLATDEVEGPPVWEGWVEEIIPMAESLQIICGGLLSGLAARRQRQFPLWRYRADAGIFLWNAITQLGQPATPYFGPTTGVTLTRFGGLNWLDYILQLLTLATDSAGQWTIGRDRTDRVWDIRRKDRTTIHGTVYFDTTRIRPDSIRATRGPSRVYVTGTEPDGERIRFVYLPGANKGPVAPYPYTDGRTIDPGTTDAETDTGDGITRMLNRLIVTGLLTRRDALEGGYDADVSRAIRALQRKAGISRTGRMNPATWDALYDVAITGQSLRQSFIAPAAELDSVRRWNRTAAGSIMSSNPAYDPRVAVRDTNIDMGPGLQKDQVTEWAERKLDNPNKVTWAGTITIPPGSDPQGAGRTALIRGEHNPGVPLGSGDVLPLRDVEPGWNLWAPHYQGGQLFHVASVEHKGDGTCNIVVDTSAGDQLEVWERVRRNRESRRSPARIWLDERSSTIGKDFGEWDSIGGWVDRTELQGDRWNLIEVFAGQSGTLQLIELSLRNNACEFAAALFGRQVTPEALTLRVPTPLAEASMDRWSDPGIQAWLRGRVWLESWGRFDQPCGYWPRKKTSDRGNNTGAPVTGDFKDQGGFSFHTFEEPVLYLLIWPRQDTVLQPGHAMRLLLDAGA